MFKKSYICILLTFPLQVFAEGICPVGFFADDVYEASHYAGNCKSNISYRVKKDETNLFGKGIKVYTLFTKDYDGKLVFDSIGDNVDLVYFSDVHDVDTYNDMCKTFLGEGHHYYSSNGYIPTYRPHNHVAQVKKHERKVYDHKGKLIESQSNETEIDKTKEFQIFRWDRYKEYLENGKQNAEEYTTYLQRHLVISSFSCRNEPIEPKHTYFDSVGP